MMMKPSLPQGTRDFGPETIIKRNFIFDTIRSTFQLYGFMPLETPAFENVETLMGKYGDEGDKLIFKILNNGLERKEKHEQAKSDFEEVLQGRTKKGLTERALRYDLTIPFARYVAMNQGQLTFPFKRYQIQPVWRADKPQRGRYREFYQCDADIVGSTSLFNEIELINLYQDVFKSLQVPIQLCVNNRKILAALAELCGGEQFLTPITVAIDKLDKIGQEKVLEELKQREISDEAFQRIKKYLSIAKLETNEETLSSLNQLFENNALGNEGISELQYLTLNCPSIRLDVTLARGLNYYTGSIFEVKPLGIQMGSIGGGGRYDNLTELFGVPNIAGVGISFGVDRIYDVMDELKLFPENLTQTIQVMLVNMGAQFETKNAEILSLLRMNNISCELYPEALKFDKQLKYANKRNVAFVGIVGDDELASKQITIKNFSNGSQSKIEFSALVDFLKS